jgi:hypothetical protein
MAGWRLPIFKNKAGRDEWITSGVVAIQKLQIRVALFEHRGKPRDFFLATALFTRLFEMPVIAHNFERALAIDFFLQPTQCTVHRFAFF